MGTLIEFIFNVWREEKFRKVIGCTFANVVEKLEGLLTKISKDRDWKTAR